MAEKKQYSVKSKQIIDMSWLSVPDKTTPEAAKYVDPYRRSGDLCRFAVEQESRLSHASKHYKTWQQPVVRSEQVRQHMLSSHSGMYLRIFSGDHSKFPAVQIAAAIDFCRNIGGDFYSIYKLPGKRVGVVIADVCGKDKHAAVYVPVIQETLYHEINSGLYAGQILGVINNKLNKLLPDDRFATLFLGIYDTLTHSLEFANAGHPAGVLLHTNGNNSQSASTGPGLGMMTDMKFGTSRISVSPDELLVLYTDGYALDMESTETGQNQDGFFNMLDKNRFRSARDIVRAIQDHMQNRLCLHTARDDRTMMVLQFSGTDKSV